ncbi:MAG: phosphate signaling complex protein PhoU [candidate division KSB1 bacterium]|nr:phosphate signaling complex protein PhoU [candidate division KSB1 bacterium]
MYPQSEFHYEQSLQHDLDDLRQKVLEMARLDELALQQSMDAFYNNNRQLAYIVILRDQMIDELEIELDQLCLRFLVRQQPVAGHLRFVYSVIKIISELERIGDYAESIARHVIRLIPFKLKLRYDLFKKLADISITMFHKSVEAFVHKDTNQSVILMDMEEEADRLRSDIYNDLYRMRNEGTVPLEALGSLMAIAGRLERVSDHAKNFCEETLYITTGEMVKHKKADMFNILFVDQNNSSLSQMAEAIGRSMKLPKFSFSSAGLTPEPIDETTRKFLIGKGIDISNHFSKSFEVLSQRQRFHVIALLGIKHQSVKALHSMKSLILDWPIKFLKAPQPGDRTVELEQAYNYLAGHIRDLVLAILGRDQDVTKV